MEPCLHVVVSYFNARQPERAAEYDECVRRNLANPFVAGLHNLLEPGVVVPEEFRAHPKYHEEQLGRWMTYHDAFQYANRRLAGQVVCICNLDIFLDAQGTDWRQAAADVRREPLVFCLSRHEYDSDGRVYTDPGFARLAFANTQDAWIFLAPFEVPDCEFQIGTLGCDNAIAHRIRKAGRQPINAPQRYKILHYDRCRGKSSGNQFQVHSQDRTTRGLSVSSYPEKQGYYLVPDFDAVKSVDAVLNALGVNDLRKYAIICDLLTQLIRINNDPASVSKPSAGVPPPKRPE